MQRYLLVLLVAGASSLTISFPAQTAAAPASPQEMALDSPESPLRERFLPPTRIVWQSDAGVTNADNLLLPKPGQAVLKESVPPCVLTTASKDHPAGIVFDFGVELQGYVELFTPMTKDHTPVPVRVRFGESVSEAMSDIGDRSAENDHASARSRSPRCLGWGKRRSAPAASVSVRIDAVDSRAAGLPEPGARRAPDARSATTRLVSL